MGPHTAVLAAAAALAIAVPPAEAAWQRHANPARGWSLSVPAGWQLRLAGRDFVDPSLCVELRSPGERRRGPVRFHASGVSPRGVEIRVVQLLTGRGPANDRRPFRLATMAPPGAVMWTDGGLYAFRERSRSIYVGVLVGARAAPALRRAAERIVNGLRIQPRPARCPESTPS